MELGDDVEMTVAPALISLITQDGVDPTMFAGRGSGCCTTTGNSASVGSDVVVEDKSLSDDRMSSRI